MELASPAGGKVKLIETELRTAIELDLIHRRVLQKQMLKEPTDTVTIIEDLGGR